jgi:dihydroorotase
VPDLKVVMEHITTADAAAFVAAAPANIAATITPQHMLLNRNALFAVSGLLVATRMHVCCVTFDILPALALPLLGTLIDSS